MAKSTPGTSASKGSAQTVPNKRFRPLPVFNPQPRPPMNQFYGSGASNFYRRPGYSYGVPTGLGALLSGQQSPFGRMVDPATGFPQRSFPRSVEAEADARETARQKEEERKRYQPGGSMSRTRPADEKTTYQQMLEGTYQPDDRAKSLGYTSSSGKGGSKGGARTVNPGSQAVVDEYNRNPDPTLGESLSPPTYGTVTGLPSGLTPEQARLRQEELASRRGGGFSRLAPGNVQVSDLFRGAVGRVPMFGNNPPQTSVRQYTGSPPLTVQERTGFSGAMEQAGVRPNIRPTMNVGKATGGPVGIHSGIASLVGRR